MRVLLLGEVKSYPRNILFLTKSKVRQLCDYGNSCSGTAKFRIKTFKKTTELSYYFFPVIIF